MKFNWSRFWHHVLISILVVIATLGLGAVVLPAIWYHELWPDLWEPPVE